MRAYERQPGESAKAFEAYKVYRDLGPGRTLRETAAIVYGGSGAAEGYREGTKGVPGRIKKWSADHDWPERARARDDYLEMVVRQAVEDHERKRAEDLAARREELRRRNLENEERAAAVEAKYLARAEELIETLPLVSQKTVRQEADGKPAIYLIEPATKDAVLDASRLHKIAKASEPNKVSLTDPTGEHEHGRSVEEIEREFEEAFGSGALGEEAGADGSGPS